MSQREEARLLGMSAEREARLLARIQEQSRLADRMAEALRAMVMEADSRRCGLKIADDVLAEYDKLKGKK